MTSTDDFGFVKSSRYEKRDDNGHKSKDSRDHERVSSKKDVRSNVQRDDMRKKEVKSNDQKNDMRKKEVKRNDVENSKTCVKKES